MRKLNLKNHKIAVFGIQGSGKTELAKKLIRTEFDNGIGLRVTSDYDDLDNLTLIQSSYGNFQEEVEEIARHLCLIGREVEEGERKKHEYDIFIIEEADMLFKSNYDIGKYMTELIAKHRHYKISIMFVTRRPQDIPAKIMDSCKHKFIFIVEGKNVMRRMDGIDKRLRILIEDELKFERHNFIYKELGKQPILHKPIKLD